MDDITALRAQVMADRFALQGLWAAFLKSQGATLDWVPDIHAEASAILEEAAENEPDDIAAAVLNHHDLLWDGIRHHLEGQLSPPE